ncbi:MAG: S8 family serine peptidase [Nevskia sp.]|nr:S8 family serine peptidase [Nevskia sp.]
MRFTSSFIAASLAALSVAGSALAQTDDPSAGRFVTYPNLPRNVVSAAKAQWFDANGGKNGAQSKLTFNLTLLNQEYLNFKQTGAGGPLFVPKTDSVNVVEDRSSGNYYVSIDALAVSSGAQLRADLEALGLKDIYNTPLPAPFDQAQQQAEQILADSLVVGGLLPIDSLPQAAQLASLRAARASFSQANAGTVTSQGDRAQNSEAARSQFGIDGSDVPAFLGLYGGYLNIRGVSVFSDSFNCLGGMATDIANGDLPPASETFDIVDFCPGGEDEGRAMAQIVHDVAPGAPISFFTAFNSELDFAIYILISGIVGIPVQVDDVQYFDEPMFQDGWLAQIIEYNQTNFHTTHFSSAGNEARQSYDAPFNPATLKPNQIPAINNLFGGSVMQGFTSSSGGTSPLLPVEIPPGDEVILSFQWDDPDFAQSACTLFGGSGCSGPQTDMDIYLLDENYCLVAGSFDDNFVTGQPVELFGFVNDLTLIGLDPCGQAVKTTNFYIAIVNFAGPNPSRVKFVEFTGAMYIPPQYDTLSSTIFGHANAEHAIAVGAAKYDRTPAFGINPARLEFFSSAGGTPILFDTSGNRLSAPILRTKPDVTAPDGGDIANTFQGQFGADTDGDGFPNFFGTSAAAPHAAGAGILLMDENIVAHGSRLSEEEIRQTLMGTAHDVVSRSLNTNTFFNSPQQINDVLGPIGSGFDCDSGAGLIDALAGVTVWSNASPVAPPIPGPPPCSGPAPTKPPLQQFILRNGQIIPVSFTVNNGGSSGGGSGGSTTTTITSHGGAFDPVLLIGLPTLLALRRRKGWLKARLQP